MPDRPVQRLRLLRRGAALTVEPLGYAAAVAALRARGRFGISLGLERIRHLLHELGHPETALRGALVAGTNGKGSVVALTGAVLQAAGLRVGSMPKPHLVRYRERIAIDGTPISAARFAAALAEVLPAVDRVAARVGPPTEFEVLTAAAFAELAGSEVDVALVEVGMGGRLDATNVLDPGVAVVTNVQHDHERHLGSTLAAIGAEKAAIIKAGNLAVTGAHGRGLRPIRERSERLRVPLRRAGRGQRYRVELRRVGWDGIVVDAMRPSGMLPELRIGLLGRHQAANAAVALALLDALAEDGEGRGHPIRLDDATIRAGMAAARWPGRLELLHGTGAWSQIGRVLLDGAHNPAGASVLAGALDDLQLHGAPLVFGAMRDKRVAGMLRPLAARGVQPIFTRVDDPKARSPEELAATWRRLTGRLGRTAESPGEALACAAEVRRGDEPIVVAGSLYLVGAVRGLLTGEGDEDR